MKLLLVLALLLAGCARPMKAEDPCNYLQNSMGRRVSWGMERQATMYMHENIPSEFRDTIRSAADKWNLAIGRDVIVIRPGVVGGYGFSYTDGYSVIYYNTEWRWESNIEGLTTAHWSGSYLTETDIAINGNYKFSTNYFDLESLMVHEFGHALGLAHNLAEGSVMNPYLARGEVRRSIEEVDYKTLSCEY